MGQLMKLHAMDGFVGADVHITGLRAELPSSGGRNIAKPVSFVRRSQVHLGVFARFSKGFLAPAACDHHVHHARAAEVERHDGVLADAAPLHEQDFEVVGYRQNLLEVGMNLFVNGHEVFAAVAHFHDAHARGLALGVRPVEHVLGRLLQHFGWQGSRTR